MKLPQRLSVCVLLLLCVTLRSDGGNILVWYAEGSHWINLKPVLETLVDRGHQVTVLLPNATLFMDSKEQSRFRFEPFNVPVSMEQLQAKLNGFFHFAMYEMDHMSFLQIYTKIISLWKNTLAQTLMFLDGVVKTDTIEKLKKDKYDVLFADPINAGSELTADILGIPLVLSLRSSLGNNWERHCGQLPAPPSYVPATVSKLTDKMSFFERIRSFLFYSLHDFLMDNIFWTVIDKHYSEIKGKPTSACQLLGNAKFWLIRTYWDFDFPRPLLPNFKNIGGIHCKPAKPLPEEMEEFAQSSGDAGIVVFTLGSMIQNISSEKANMIASGLAQIPQKVLWRYKGKMPDTLGANTKIFDWIPQNNLLGHPKMKAFITHGGTNGIYEAIYHGVPMVGIPLFADQPDNMVHMKAKGVAITLDFNFMTAEDLRDAVNLVINDKSYKDNAMRLSRIHHDRPMNPRDEAVFWLEYTMRHKETQHLRVQSHELTWYQYHSLDVLAFLLSIVLLFTLLFIKTCKFCFRRCFGRTANTKGKTE